MTQHTDTAKTIKVVTELPKFSRLVYGAILEGLYAEPGFSDLEASDIAHRLSVTAEAVGGALTKLIACELVELEEPATHLEGSPVFIHAAAHDDDYAAELLAVLPMMS